MFEIKRYTSDDRLAWDEFVARSKNGVFQFLRSYMDYHADRFSDCSLLFFRKKKLYALLPANAVGDVLFTHQGLSYGGLVTDERATAAEVCELFRELNDWLRACGFRMVHYKPVPSIYHSMPAEEAVYALTLVCHARLVSRDMSSVLLMSHRPKFTESRRSGLRKAVAAGLTVTVSSDVRDFWTVLEENLKLKYQSKPVHTADEMSLLMERFPGNIRLYVVKDAGGTTLGGTVLYLTPQVVRTQYISASAAGKACGAIDLLFDELLNRADFKQPYFDFGTSAMSHSNEMIASLIFQKEGFGGRGICFDQYEWEL